MRNIVALSEGLSEDHADILAGKRFRVGTAQKALNLYLKYLWCLQNSPVADRKTDSQSVGFSLNGTPLRIATLHVTHSKDERGPESGFRILSNLFIFNNMAERVGFENKVQRTFNNMQSQR